jgi:hypothetical protein
MNIAVGALVNAMLSLSGDVLPDLLDQFLLPKRALVELDLVALLLQGISARLIHIL